MEYVIKHVRRFRHRFRKWYRLTLGYPTGHTIGRIAVHEDFLRTLSEEDKNIEKLQREIIDSEIEVRTARQRKREMLAHLEKEKNIEIAQNPEKKSSIVSRNNRRKSEFLREFRRELRGLRKKYCECSEELKRVETYQHLNGRRLRLHFI